MPRCGMGKALSTLSMRTGKRLHGEKVNCREVNGNKSILRCGGAQLMSHTRGRLVQDGGAQANVPHEGRTGTRWRSSS